MSAYQLPLISLLYCAVMLQAADDAGAVEPGACRCHAREHHWCAAAQVMQGCALANSMPFFLHQMMTLNSDAGRFVVAAVPVCIFVFDLLFRDGVSLLHLPLEERRRQLAEALPAMRPGYCQLGQVQLFQGAEEGGGGGGGGGGEGGPDAGEEPAFVEQQQEQQVGEEEDEQQEQRQQLDEEEQEEGSGMQDREGQAGGAAPLPPPHVAQQQQGQPAAAEEEGSDERGLEDKLQELLLEAFAAGTGERAGGGGPRRWERVSLAAVQALSSPVTKATHSALPLPSFPEGLMLKSLSGPYQPSKRSDHWLKLKRDYCEPESMRAYLPLQQMPVPLPAHPPHLLIRLTAHPPALPAHLPAGEGLHDTLDLVPIGAWHGSGRKAGWHSPYLLACWDGEREELQSVCRVMSGFSDAFYKDALVR